jgi:hypothetical protein
VNIYSTTIRIFTGKEVTFAVRSVDEVTAKYDLATAIHDGVRMPYGSFHVKEVIQQSDNFVLGMTIIGGFRDDDGPYAWMVPGGVK